MIKTEEKHIVLSSKVTFQDSKGIIYASAWNTMWLELLRSSQKIELCTCQLTAKSVNFSLGFHSSLNFLSQIHSTRYICQHDKLIFSFMEPHDISLAVGNILQDFISELKYCYQTIAVNFHAFKRPYGSKIVICTKNRKNKTIFYFLVKIQSGQELECLKHIINGIQSSLDYYYTISSQIGSDSD